MPQLGRKYTCYSCHTKFYDLGKPVPLCPKCNADQRDAEDAPVVSSSRGRRAAPPPPVIDEPIEEPEFGSEAEATESEGEGEDEIVEPEPEPDAADEEEEEY